MLDKETTPTANVKPDLAAKYRGACVEDLQLPPAFCLSEDAPISHALEAAYEREFDQLPILNDRRRPIGYLYVPTLKQKFEGGSIKEDDPVSRCITHFPLSSKSHPYTVIDPLTPLEELEQFFISAGTDFALVTDVERKWVLAVATKDDLETFVKRRG
ncbi:uncharacterized protein I206_100673 [Kwoniella pini CBS 10737]|uniref:CBS domain-containing protein n=1 Tax=Kwoniella pini CBS 10737 TaxID=1296096 RepID=A0A1B9IDF3_9TREE|nr:uncharacterized protein I206_00652 [Kwoniella pini CBS 10737]OCF53350.1 hypothetical protein I206_00652 [Kwoniella pini CBS 10737]